MMGLAARQLHAGGHQQTPRLRKAAVLCCCCCCCCGGGGGWTIADLVCGKRAAERCAHLYWLPSPANAGGQVQLLHHCLQLCLQDSETQAALLRLCKKSKWCWCIASPDAAVEAQWKYQLLHHCLLLRLQDSGNTSSPVKILPVMQMLLMLSTS
jgi:hypothetical protein